MTGAGAGVEGVEPSDDVDDFTLGAVVETGLGVPMPARVQHKQRQTLSQSNEARGIRWDERFDNTHAGIFECMHGWRDT